MKKIVNFCFKDGSKMSISVINKIDYTSWIENSDRYIFFPSPDNNNFSLEVQKENVCSVYLEFIDNNIFFIEPLD